MMRLFSLLAVFILASPGHAEEKRPQILQSLCNPKEPNAEFSPFGFELIQSGERWAAKVYPVSGALHPVSTIEIPEARVSFVAAPKPEEFVIALVQSVTVDSHELTVIALSNVKSEKPQPFIVTVDTLKPDGNGGDKIYTVEANCSFVNEDAPYDRKPL
jgi:hypothetical protein